MNRSRFAEIYFAGYNTITLFTEMKKAAIEMIAALPSYKSLLKITFPQVALRLSNADRLRFAPCDAFGAQKLWLSM